MTDEMPVINRQAGGTLLHENVVGAIKAPPDF